MKEKEEFVMSYIKNDLSYQEIRNQYNYTIEQYLDNVRFLYWDDLIYRIRIESQDFTNFDQYKLQEYANFLIWMHKLVSEKGITDKQEIKKMHLHEYNWYRQTNVINQDKKFFLL